MELLHSKTVNSESLPEAVNCAGCLTYFSIHSWTVLVTEEHRCVSLSCPWQSKTEKCKCIYYILGFFNKTTVQNRSHLPKQKENDSFSYLLPLNRSCWLPALHFVLPEYSSAAAPSAPAERRGSFFLCQELPPLSASGSVSPSAGGAGSPALFGCCWVSCWSTAKGGFNRHKANVL